MPRKKREEETIDLEPDVIEEKKEEVFKPEPDFVFDGEIADDWLARAWRRKTDRYQTVLYDPAGVPENQIHSCMLMAYRLVIPGGRLYAPKELGDALNGLAPDPEVRGDWAEITRD